MKLSVYKFNQMRNEFEWDSQLEIKMYQEEAREFFDAKNLAQRVDAVIDCQYVRMGTEMKMAANGIQTMPYQNREYLMHEIIANEIEAKFTPMSQHGDSLTSCNDGYNLVNVIMGKAQKIVCQANELKGLAKSAEGKVLKDASYEEKINATHQIAAMIDEELARAKS